MNGANSPTAPLSSAPSTQAAVNDLEAAIELQGSELRCVGAWTVMHVAAIERWLEGRPSFPLEQVAGEPAAVALTIDGSAIRALDTAGAWLLRRIVAALEYGGHRVSVVALRPEHRTLLELVEASAAQTTLDVTGATPNAMARLGRHVWTSGRHGVSLLEFVGRVAIAALRSLARPARIRWRPILFNIRTAGFDALPITGLLVFLMGVVIAYQGASQLRRYGANIFVADLVGLAMLRELSPLLTAIIVAGRSGSAYAAQIGTMKVTEEVDALRTVGIPPIEQLVLPKLAALVIALPLLTVYADILGVAGGMVMASSELDVGFADFIERLQYALVMSDYLVGIGKAPIFAAIISVIGCFQGFQVAGDAESVGHRTTVSVVQSIFLVIVADALFSVVFNRLGI
jgi:phospholipid/cholesterol/gamma-HCH transport system permease protein